MLFLYGIYIQNQTVQNSVSPKQNCKISKAHSDTSINPYYKQLGILKFEDIYKLEVAKIMHTIWNKQHPENLSQYFTKISSQHDRSTHSSSPMFSTPLLKTLKLQQSHLSGH